MTVIPGQFYRSGISWMFPYVLKSHDGWNVFEMLAHVERVFVLAEIY